MTTAFFALIGSIALSAPKAVPVSKAAEPKAATAPREAVKFTLDPERRVYDVGINYNYQTTVWMPVGCEQPALGEPDKFAVLFDPSKQLQRRFIVTAAVEAPGAVTNITFDCEQNTRVVLVVKQVPAEHAVLSVEFEFDASENARVRHAIETERDRSSKECATQLDSKLAELEGEAQERFMRGMLRRLWTADDIELAREDFVIVKVYREIVAGDIGYILFSVQNRTSREVVLKDATVSLDGDADTSLPGARLVMPQRRIAPDTISDGIIVFEAPEEGSTFALTVVEDGPRRIRVDDIDFDF